MEIKDILKQMLADNAFNNQMQVEEDFSKAIQAINYLMTQLDITKRFCTEEGKEHIQSVIESTIEILM